MTSRCVAILIMVLWLKSMLLLVAHGQENEGTACQNIDLAFVIDASGSICDSDKSFNLSTDETCNNWKFVVDFVEGFVNTLNIGPNFTMVAAVTFATDASLRWNLNAYSDKPSLINAIRTQLTYKKAGRTNTTGALNIVNTKVFNTADDRSIAINIAIIITDGKPTDPSTVPDAINAVHSSGIRTLVVGVTNETDDNTLKTLSSPPQLPNITYFWAVNFDSIDQVRQQLVVSTCSPTLPSIQPPTSILQSSAPPALGCQKIDFCFLVDRSGSICDTDRNFSYQRDDTCSNWNQIVTFIHNIVNEMDIGPDNIRVAVVIFASSSQVEWGLGDFTDKASLLNAIDKLPYIKGGTTDTAGGLRLMNTQVFNTPDDRPDASNTAIIITDGKPTEPSEVPAAIMAVHNSNIRTLVVGVTNSIDEMTLKQLASSPPRLGESYFMATDFSTIELMRKNIQNQACLGDIIGSSGSVVRMSTNSGDLVSCPNTLDLVFMVDGSGSICDSDESFVYSRDSTCKNWNLVLQFVHNVTDRFNIGPTATRIAMVTFSSTSRLVWGLDEYYDKNSLLYAIDNLMYQKGGTTDTTGALNIVKDEVFTAQLNRPNGQKTAIIITDGKPTNPATVPNAIDAVHARDIRTLVVGVTSQVNVDTLELLSSPPKELGKTYFTTSDFTTIQEIREQLLNQACPDSTLSPTSISSTPTTVLSSTTTSLTTSYPTSKLSTLINTPIGNTLPTGNLVCREKMDVAFAVDASGSICDSDPTFSYLINETCSNWNKTLQFVEGIVSYLNIGIDATRVGMVTFASNANLLWTLTKYTSRDSLIEAIRSISYHKGGQTDTTGALNLMRTEVFGTSDDRPDIMNIAIILTDGKPTDPTTVQAAIDAVHSADITTFVVGVTNATDDAMLKQLSSHPQQINHNYFYAAAFDSLDMVRSELQNQTCTVAQLFSSKYK